MIPVGKKSSPPYEKNHCKNNFNYTISPRKFKTMHQLLIALQFLTRLPVKSQGECSDEQVAMSVLYYPLVGLIIGLLLWLIAYAFSGTTGMLSAVMVLTVWVFITGGLHLDGLADSADAWAGGYGNKQRSLEIMKDPAAGPLAVVVLILLLLIKFSALVILIENDHLWSLLVSPVMGRISVIVLFVTTPYVRQQGLGSSIAEYLNHIYAYTVLLVTLVVGMFFIPLSLLTLLTSSCFIVLIFLRHMMIKRLGGMTGDTIGASLEIIEAVSLFVMVIVLS